MKKIYSRSCVKNFNSIYFRPCLVSFESKNITGKIKIRLTCCILAVVRGTL